MVPPLLLSALPLLPLLPSEVVAGGGGDVGGDDAVVPPSPSLAALEFSEGIVGHFPFTGIKPSGHSVDGGLTVLPLPPPPPLLSLPLLEDGVVAADVSSVDVFVSSEPLFFAAKTVVEPSNIKAAVVTDKTRIKIINVEIILEFCMAMSYSKSPEIGILTFKLFLTLFIYYAILL